MRTRLRAALQPLFDRAESAARDILEIRTEDPLASRFASFVAISRIEWPRVAIVNPASVSIGEDTYIRRDVCIEALAVPGNVVLAIGDRVQVGYYVRFVALNGVFVGDDAGIGHGCTVTDTVHVFKDDDAPSGWKAPLRVGRPLRIGAGAWLGNNSVVTGGLEIGEGAITAPNSVINRNVPPETIVGGNPARVLRRKRAGQWEWLIDPDELDLETQLAAADRQS